MVFSVYNNQAIVDRTQVLINENTAEMKWCFHWNEIGHMD